MKQILIIALALSISLIAGCGKPAPTDTVESLVANPERLKELRAQCKADHAKVGDAVCGAVSEATRRRFDGRWQITLRERSRAKTCATG